MNKIAQIEKLVEKYEYTVHTLKEMDKKNNPNLHTGAINALETVIKDLQKILA